MTEIRLYHCQSQPPEKVLPKILEKIVTRGWRAVVWLGSEDQISELDQFLWEYEQTSFLPHGCMFDQEPEIYPIWLTTKEDNPNHSNVLILIDHDVSTSLGSYEIICVFLRQETSSIQKIFEYWKNFCLIQAYTLTYYHQNQPGQWQTETLLP